MKSFLLALALMAAPVLGAEPPPEITPQEHLVLALVILECERPVAVEVVGTETWHIWPRQSPAFAQALGIVAQLKAVGINVPQIELKPDCAPHAATPLAPDQQTTQL